MLLLTKPFQLEESDLSYPLLHPDQLSAYQLSAYQLSAYQLSAYQLSAYQLSVHQLDVLIDQAIYAYFATDILHQFCLCAKASSPEQVSLPTRIEETPEALPLLFHKRIAEDYASVCTLLWKVLFASEQAITLTHQIQRLSFAWAECKYHLPNHALVENTLTKMPALQARWRSPHVQTALESAAAQLLTTQAQTQDDAQSEPSIARYPSSWAYLCGCLMHQLLQWNHQLTPEILRELFA